MDLLEELCEALHRHRNRHKPAAIGLIFPYFNLRSYSVNTVSIPLGQFVLGTVAYLTSAGLPALDSNGSPVPLVGPIIVSNISDAANLTATVNSDNTLAIGVGDSAPVGSSATFTISDSSPTPLTGEVTINYGASVEVGVPASLGVTFGPPQSTAPTS
jgi:hypothetical protein